MPPGLRIYAIGDIHGSSELLDRLFDEIADDLGRNPCDSVHFVFLGDYVDRGPDTKGVLDRLIEFGRNNSCTFLKGNHEEMLMSFLAAPTRGLGWLYAGGWNMLESYGINRMPEQTADLLTIAADLRAAMPDEHFAFLNALEIAVVEGPYYFVHAGIRPGLPLAQQRVSDLLWIKDEFLNSEHRYEKIIVHGHTPVDRIHFGANRINVDTGAHRTGRLSCAVLGDSGPRGLSTVPTMFGSETLAKAWGRLRNRVA
ncbi:MAG: metallophosphoesterase family protein [Hyphomicrobium sp.]|nr:metallophosphoesterase family protein [Hyphomicrobium sp.]